MGAIWEYAWAPLVEDYSAPGFARLVQQAPPPIYVPPGDQPPPPPPPPPERDAGTITAAFGRRYSERHVAQSLSGGAAQPGQDRIVTWRYSYDYGGQTGRGFCLDQDDVPVSQWSYGMLAANPIIVDVPNIMLSQHIAGWKSMNLRINGAYDPGFVPWGDPVDPLACGVPARVEGSATMRVLRASDAAQVVDGAGADVRTIAPSQSFRAEMGRKVAPDPWPAWQVRVDHDCNRIMFFVEVVVYVSLTSTTAPPPPDENAPGGATGPPPPPPALGAVALNGILRPPC